MTLIHTQISWVLQTVQDVSKNLPSDTSLEISAPFPIDFTLLQLHSQESCKQHLISTNNYIIFLVTYTLVVESFPVYVPDLHRDVQMQNIGFVTKIQDVTHIHLYRLWDNERFFFFE